MKRAPPLLIIAVAILVVIQTGALIKVTNDLVSDIPVQGIATGTVSLCINYPPSISESCNTTLNQSTRTNNYTYYCQIDFNTTDANEKLGSAEYNPIIQNGLKFSVNDSGWISVWANQSGIGLFASTITIYDNATCPLSDDLTYTFQIVDINDPPEFRGSLPSVLLGEGTTISYTFLNTFFYDPDGDSLSFSASSTSFFQVIILPSSEVRIVNPANQCEDETVYFTATDPYDGSDVTNMVELRADCDEAPVAPGGGGGSVGCLPEWKCQRWGPCMPDGFRSRTCIDLNGCDTNNLRKNFTERCDYEQTCFDGIQNQDETGVDCGGVCPACPVAPTCDDGIRNQGEESVDCGGPCDECVVVETCFDGVKNQDEIGIDCGGVCEACKEIVIPGLVEEQDNSLLSTALIVLLVLAAMFVAYVLFRKEIRSLLAKLGWWITRKKRKQILLGENDKIDMLKIISDLEKRLALDQKTQVFKSDEAIVQRLLSANRLYFVKIFNLPLEFTDKDVIEKSETVLFHMSLKNIFKSLMEKQYLIEKKRILISRTHFAFMIQELKQLVYSTSPYIKSHMSGAAREFKVEGSPLTQVIRLLHNSMVALQYFEVGVAEERYLKILALYELLSDKEKNVIYADISRLYNHISYELAWT